MPPKATAKINGKVIAESDEYETVEGNIYVRDLLQLPRAVTSLISKISSYS